MLCLTRYILLSLLFSTLGCAHQTKRDSGPLHYTGDRADFCVGVEPIAKQVAEAHGVQFELLMAIMRVESHFNPNAVSRAGAVGLTQVMPRTASGNKCGNLKDPKQNIECGARVLAKFLKRYDGNLLYGLSAYNGGYRTATRANKSAELPRNERYVEKVLMAKGRFVRGGCSLLVREF